MMNGNDYPSTDSELDREEAYQLGALHPNRAWIGTDRDVWHKNPFYTGPPVPHPDEGLGDDWRTQLDPTPPVESSDDESIIDQFDVGLYIPTDDDDVPF